MKITGCRLQRHGRLLVMVGDPLTTRVYEVEVDAAESTASVLYASELVGKKRMRCTLTDEERCDVARFAAQAAVVREACEKARKS